MWTVLPSLPPWVSQSAALVPLCGAIFVDVLMVNCVNLMTDTMQTELRMSDNETQWLVSGYSLTFSSFLLLSGRLCDTDWIGPRRVFVVGMVWLAIWTAVCGVATDGVTINIFRALQGLGGAATTPSATSLIVRMYGPGGDRQAVGFPMALACLSVFGSLGSVLGMVFGGLLTYAVSWRYVFYLTGAVVLVLLGMALAWVSPDRVPVGNAVTAFVGGTSDELAKRRPTRGRHLYSSSSSSFGPALHRIQLSLGGFPIVVDSRFRRSLSGISRFWSSIDGVGATLCTSGLVLFCYGLSSGGASEPSGYGGWISAVTLGTILAGLVFLAVFFVWEGRRAVSPLIPPYVWANGGPRIVLGLVFLSGVFRVPYLYYAALQLQQVLGMDVLTASLASLALGGAAGITSLAMGKRIVLHNARAYIVVGFVGMTVGSVLLVFVTTDTSYWSLNFPAFVLSMAGMALARNATNLVCMSGASPQEKGLYGALFNTSLQLSGAISLAAISSVIGSLGVDSETSYRLAFYCMTACTAIGTLVSLAWWWTWGRYIDAPPQESVGVRTSGMDAVCVLPPAKIREEELSVVPAYSDNSYTPSEMQEPTVYVYDTVLLFGE
jgi:MFS family permease